MSSSRRPAELAAAASVWEVALAAPGSSLSDPARMRALEEAGLLDSPAESAFDRLTQLAATVVEAPIVLVSLVTEDRQFFKSQCGLPAPVSEERETPLSHSFCQHVVLDREPLVVSDAREDPRLAGNLAIADLGVIAYAGFPLITAEGHVLGSFCAIDERARDWTPRQLALLEGLAATTMDIVRMRAEALAAAEAGQRLQAALVPAPPALETAEVAALYRPGERHLLVGGDFYQCVQMPDDSIDLLIGDVAGHGPEAAAFAAGLRSAWRAMLLSDAPMDELVSRLNTVALVQQPSPGLFATALACRIAPDRRSVAVSSAGHPPAILIERGRVRELASTPGLPLGISQDAHSECCSFEIAADSRLLIYTDGLIEGRQQAASSDRLGIAPVLEELQRLFDAGVDGQPLLAALVDFAVRAHGAKLPDDVAALLVRLR